ncbi:phosphodiester glycosidase family protein [Aquibacillus sediminis]|uniref:phosphodiester glycosidase family protein n=1 Tax=Aquibacillus sediminis TaxID=2574734 RepID=UPI0011084785|nr:phosphodiester glycosidase family protein [Aquibacillus sediminis]
MSRHRKRFVFSIRVIVLMTLVATFSLPLHTEAAPTIEEKVYQDFKVSDGIHFQSNRILDGSDTSNQAINVMEIDTTNPYANIGLGHASNLNKLQTTTSQAVNYHTEDNKVVGAINGSFFNIDDSTPMYLIAKNGQLIFGGSIYQGEANYVNEPIAFGVDQNGKGVIDHYALQLSYTHNDNTHKIASVNKKRSPDETILYTPDFHSDYTETSSMGKELVVSLPESPNMTFDSTYQGTVTAIRERHDDTKTEIPEKGFVISGHGTDLFNMSDIEVGDDISVSIQMDKKWHNSSFMLASGPMLVKDGKVDLSMDPTSWRATTRSPKTAVAIDETGERIFFVTVDGRQNGYSDGMSMVEFAEYLVGLGVDRALNMDGGGSTTMATRYPGQELVQLANSPSDGRERGVSSILMAISNSPDTMYYTDVYPGGVHNDGIYWLTTKGIKGYLDGEFGVKDTLTRPHAATMFTKALSLDTPSTEVVETYFEDVSASNPYAQYIAAVAEAGIFRGDGENFLINQKLTRDQMAQTLVNAFDLKRFDTDEDKQVDIYLGNVNPVFKDDVQLIANLGITKQRDDFIPKQAVTRGEFASFLYRTMQFLEQQEN